MQTGFGWRWPIAGSVRVFQPVEDDETLPTTTPRTIASGTGSRHCSLDRKTGVGARPAMTNAANRFLRQSEAPQPSPFGYESWPWAGTNSGGVCRGRTRQVVGSTRAGAGRDEAGRCLVADCKTGSSRSQYGTRLKPSATWLVTSASLTASQIVQARGP